MVMGTMDCNEFLNQLDAWMEEARHPDARAHLRGCPACRSLVEDMDAIHLAAQQLPLSDPEPPARIWNSLRIRLEEEGLIRGHLAGNTGASWHEQAIAWLDGVFAPLPRPVLAGAYLTILVALAFAAASPFAAKSSSNRWVRNTQASTMPLSAQLDSAEQTTVTSFGRSNPAASAALHKDLAIVDNYIALCEKSVSEEPENEAARDYLYEAYQQKAYLLAEMSDRGDEGQ
jgi:hypothetical protein